MQVDNPHQQLALLLPTSKLLARELAKGRGLYWDRRLENKLGLVCSQWKFIERKKTDPKTISIQSHINSILKLLTTTKGVKLDISGMLEGRFVASIPIPNAPPVKFTFEP